jgi:acetate kinase
MTQHTAPRTGLILSLNAGSSSLKISLYRVKPDPAAAEPAVLIIASALSSIAQDATFSFSSAEADTNVKALKDEPAQDILNHAKGFEYFLNHLKGAVGIDREEIVHVCHRVVHGGDYHEPVVITQDTYHHIERLSDLAPL